MEGQDSTRKPRTNALPPPAPAEVSKALGVSSITIEWLAGDGSDRCYYRLKSPDITGSYVLMQLSGSDAKALAENGYDWINIANILAGQNVFVPRVIVSMPDHAALVIEDYGDLMLENTVFNLAEESDSERILSLYQNSFKILERFLMIPKDESAPWCQRAFDKERFEWELNFFVEKYLTPAAGAHFNAAEAEQFKKEASQLSEYLASYSNYFVHRDFHSRNVMVQNQKLAVIDFQDARLGPPSYDLVSLCFDSYVPFTNQLRTNLMEHAIDSWKGTVPASTIKEVEETWKPMLLQRQLKAIGSFGFLTLDKKRGDYLKYVGPALETLLESNLEDPRWPIISKEIPHLIKKGLSRSAK